MLLINHIVLLLISMTTTITAISVNTIVDKVDNDDVES